MARGKMKKVISREPGLLIFLILMICSLSSCYIPGVGALPDVEDPPGAGDPMGSDETFYGKFILYEVANGEVRDLNGSRILYLVGDEVYFPSNDPDLSADYNILRKGMEAELTFHYRDRTENLRPASKAPEGIVLDNQLTLYYSDFRMNWTASLILESNCGTDVVGNNLGAAMPIAVNSFYVAMINNPTDLDYFQFQVAVPNSLIVAKARYSLFNSGSPEIDKRRRLKLSLLDNLGNVLAESTIGADMWKFVDPDLTFTVPNAGADYYLVVEDLVGTTCVDKDQDSYWLILESPSFDVGENLVMKGEIQPARSGNPKLNGGRTFEPDDYSTKIEDNWPDCDGIPGSGDEGDAGVNELCGSPNEFGAGDGKMQYQEVDDKNAIDDGEWFLGKPTNVPVTIDSEVSVVKAPDRKSLLMFINYGDRIYMLESLDGHIGKSWDLSNLINDRPSIIPRKYRGGGDSDAPVVSSGKLGFCDTAPAPGDDWAAPELAAFAQWGGTTNTGTGVMLNTPSGLPNKSAVTYGANKHLDSKALEDDFLKDGSTLIAIHSGKDGIVNTFFAPEYIAYPDLPSMVHNYAGDPDKDWPEPNVVPEPSMYPDLSGPGNPEGPLMFSGVSGWFNPLAAYGGDNLHAFLLGDDEWNTALFGNTIPPVYMQKQDCSFYKMGANFDMCAIGVRIDPATGEEPVAIKTGPDKILHTVTKVLRGDDKLCHEVNGSTVAVGICPGPDGRFGWEDLYLPIKGDDRLEIVVHTDPAVAGELTVGIGSGPNGVLDTTFGPPPSPAAYQLFTPYGWKVFAGGDYVCQTQTGMPAICPGVNEVVVDIFTGAATPTGARKLMSIWPLYINSPTPPASSDPTFAAFWFPKQDLYSIYDDEFCIINGGIALCPGPNGHFQSYPLNKKIIVDQDDDLFNLFDRVGDSINKDCFVMVSERYQDNWEDYEKVRYVLYRYLGVRQDDKIKWSPQLGYHITTGDNGINQSCKSNKDVGRIRFNQGLPKQPIILPGADGVFQTYPLKDEKIKFDRGVFKISTGEDGIANSFAMGDDILEIFMGTGAPDQPCVIASGDGVADTSAQWNDSQLFRPGEATGFDSYAVWSPDAMVVGDEIYLYYTALGWDVLPKQMRSSSGDLADQGECNRAGLDYLWGRNEPDYRIAFTENKESYKTIYFDLLLVDPELQTNMDNNQGVIIAPRIGLAIGNIKQLRNDPGKWRYFDKPMIDVGQQCAGAISFPIDLPLELPGMLPDVNWNGAFSPELKLFDAPDGENPLYIMYYTGMYEGEKSGKDNPINNTFTIGMFRSLDGINWEPVREMNPMVISSEFNLDAILGSSTNYATPTVVSAGEDEFGDPMYAIFFNTFEDYIGGGGGKYTVTYDMRKKDRIAYALRKGRPYFSCSVSSERWTDRYDQARSILQVFILALPIVLIFAVKLARRRPN